MIFVLLVLFFYSSNIAYAQNDDDFRLAMRFMQQQKYSQALPILNKLKKEDPDNFVYSSRLIDCLIQLKQYDKGLEMALLFKDHPQFEGLMNIRIGELYHFKGETEKAYNVWNTNIEQHANQLQIYINTANTMIERRDYLKAVSVFKKAREFFKNKQLFFADIANAYMRAGKYESAIEEWLDLLQNNPAQLSFVQRNLLNYNDPILYDITIIVLDERLQDMAVNNPLYQPYYELQLWLLQENKLYRRALAVATAYENSTGSFNYSLFNLGRHLVNAHEYEMAVQAFKYYLNHDSDETKWRSMEELANAYSKWAKYIEDFNLDFNQKKDSLYSLSYSMLEKITSESESYSRIHSVLLKKAELALDFVFSLEAAENAYQQLSSMRQMLHSPELPYLRGRIHLAKKEFPQARLAFTDANKMAKIGEMAEKTRYFLALTDFFSKDYEFSAIQLKSLGRQSTSYYANDALKLRIWLQEGLSADSSGALLDEFSTAVFNYMNGDAKLASNTFLQFMNDASFTLKDEAIIYVLNSKYLDESVKLTELSYFISNHPHTAKKEKLMWELAKHAELSKKWINLNCRDRSNCLSNAPTAGFSSAREIYEDLIIKYPQGFYAPYARERLNNISEEKNS